LVNLFPALVHVPDWFPGTSWKKTAREWREQQEHATDTSYAWAKAQIVSVCNNTACCTLVSMTGSQAKDANEPSIIASLLDHAQRLGLEAGEVDDYVKHVAVTLLAGAELIYHDIVFLKLL
jgi:hypothetical protein